MKKSLLSLAALMATSAFAQSLTADVESLYFWNYSTTAGPDYQVNEKSINITAADLTDNITYVMESSGKNKGSYLENSTRFEVGNLNLYENRSGSLYVRITSKAGGIYEDAVLVKSGDVEIRIPVKLAVAGTEGDGYWDPNDFAPLSVADANLVHDVMPAGVSYATDPSHRFGPGDDGIRCVRGMVSEVVAAADGQATLVIKDNADAAASMTIINAKADVEIKAGDVVTVEGDMCDADGVCALQSGSVLEVVAGQGETVVPAVTAEIAEATTNTVSLTFTPNEAVEAYYCCLFGVGELEVQFNMFSAWMGFKEYGDMIKAWGYPCNGVQTKTWKDLAPGTSYEIWVQSVDAAGNYSELQCFEVTTELQGGDGESVIEIVVGEFGGDEEYGYWQQVTYTPNDQTAVFFDLICTDEFYQEQGAEGVAQFLKDELYSELSDYYAQYKQDVAYWNAEPGTTYHACAIGMNAKGEWGPMSEVVFTTPGSEVKIEAIETVADQSRSYNLMGQQIGQQRGFVVRNARVEYVK